MKYVLFIILLHVPVLNAQGQDEDSTSFCLRIRDLGLDNPSNDLSGDGVIAFPEPSCAYVNMIGATHMPAYKGDTLHCLMEVYDGNGNYFRKCVVLDAQGNSSLTFPKRNVKVDFCGDGWLGEDAPTITIGDWVGQDGFHFKAYYNDYFRGLAVAGYRLYELMAADRGRPWTRSGGKSKDDPRALCHPDGFPCAVYLNGEFHGIYAWQLKKHRANMAQGKGEQRHIHLDGTLTNATFWDGEVDWTAFDVQNPKDLSEEAVDCITSLSQACGNMKRLESEGADIGIIRDEFSKRFDVASLIDYACLHYLVANYDGFAKNWQWFTYDGEMWFVSPYDLDCTFGNIDTGDFVMPAYQTGVDPYWVLYTEGPMLYLSRYFMEDIRERYRQLRGDGIVSADVAKSLVWDWWYRVGDGNYALEWSRWPDSKCIKTPQYTWCWELVDGWHNYHKTADWDSRTNYKAGDLCRIAMRVWVATADNRGVRPYATLGYTDSMDRIEGWVDERFRLVDEYLGYEESVGIRVIPDKKPLNGGGTYYGLGGIRLREPGKGLHIMVGADGKARKVIGR